MAGVRTHPTSKLKALDLAAIGGRLRELRRVRGWRLRDLAHHSGVDDSIVSLVETGKPSTRLATIVALTEALGSSLDFVVLGKGPPSEWAIDARRIGRRIRDARRSRRWVQRQLAAACGVTIADVRRWEAGWGGIPDDATLATLSKWLHRSRIHLLYGDPRRKWRSEDVRKKKLTDAAKKAAT